MAQLSMPYRIALVGLLAICAVWFAVLRPGAAVEEPAPPLPGEQLGTAVDAAQGAAAASDARNAAAAGAPGAAASAPTPAQTGGAAAPKAAATPAARAARRDPSTPLIAALDQGRAVVLLFTNGRGADDRVVRSEVAQVGRRGGEVLVRTVPLRDVGRYQAITRGVAVTASPTVLVLGPGHDARAIPGITTSREVDQAVTDALDLAGNPAAAARVARHRAVRTAERRCDGADACVAYFTSANDACLQQAASAPAAAPTTAADAMAAQQAGRAAAAAAASAVGALTPPAAARAEHQRAQTLLQRRVAAYDAALAKSTDGFAVARRLRADRSVAAGERELRRLGFGACA